MKKCSVFGVRCSVAAVALVVVGCETTTPEQRAAKAQERMERHERLVTVANDGLDLFDRYEKITGQVPAAAPKPAQPQPSVGKPVEASEPEAAEEQALPDAVPLYAPRYDLVGATALAIRDGAGGFKYRGDKGKAMFRGQFAGEIAWVTAWQDPFVTDDGKTNFYHTVMVRETPDEYGQRQRYYLNAGRKMNARPGARLFIRAHVVRGQAAADIYAELPDAAKGSD